VSPRSWWPACLPMPQPVMHRAKRSSRCADVVTSPVHLGDEPADPRRAKRPRRSARWQPTWSATRKAGLVTGLRDAAMGPICVGRSWQANGVWSGLSCRWRSNWYGGSVGQVAWPKKPGHAKNQKRTHAEHSHGPHVALRRRVPRVDRDVTDAALRADPFVLPTRRPPRRCVRHCRAPRVVLPPRPGRMV
jgi:hypothetical protein